MDIHSQISSLIQKIKNDWERANENASGISRIDRDIMISELRSLYDLVYDVEINIPVRKDFVPETREVQAVAEKAKVEIKTPTPEVPAPKPEQKELILDLFDAKAEEQHEPIQDPPEETLNLQNDDPENEVAEEVAASEEISENKPEEISSPIEAVLENQTEILPENKSKTKVQQSTSDKFQASKTLADVYQNSSDNSLAAKIQKNKITDIRTAIGINDKFLFINDIFKGEMTAYNQAIEKLNGMGHYYEAVEFINTIKMTNQVENHDASDKLVNILKRKFY